ncbi:beta-lactamase class D [Luteibacter sp. Sphag1AF]|uniref:class D beta-lactamase n=1 Tax=Luteibacter sp. Sphag1AF TaxID=2587031 RepID=UPI00160E660D|nr:class D beta-lactamase [Luteibacter sp. Sphag1AF]MBB3226402.1 beta-lactamase class D [Luteibacter sp. Sphag1AF]
MRSWLYFVPALLLPLAAFQAQATTIKERPEWAAIFDDAKTRGTIVVYDEQADRMDVFDAARAKQRYSPASTFKLFNAMVALDTGAVTDEFDVIPWDGKVRMMGGAPKVEWNRPNSLASGMRYSTVWFFQEVARRAGEPRMHDWLHRVGYGNETLEGGIDQFWLNDTLRISAEEQVAFLRRLADGKLPFSERAQEAVRRISITESQPEYVLHAKTGWLPEAAQNGSKGHKADGIGWYVGWVEAKGRRWFFAANMDLKPSSDGTQRVLITKRVLAAEGAIPPVQP